MGMGDVHIQQQLTTYTTKIGYPIQAIPQFVLALRFPGQHLSDQLFLIGSELPSL